jgi:hypothetical protein
MKQRYEKNRERKNEGDGKRKAREVGKEPLSTEQIKWAGKQQK